MHAFLRPRISGLRTDVESHLRQLHAQCTVHYSHTVSWVLCIIYNSYVTVSNQCTVLLVPLFLHVQLRRLDLGCEVVRTWHARLQPLMKFFIDSEWLPLPPLRWH